LWGDLAEDEEALVGGEGGFVVLVGAAAVADSTVGGFDHPTVRLDDEPEKGGAEYPTELFDTL
jgi:hypothetical protein